MAIIRSIPSEKVIGGRIIKSSEIVLISESEYTSNGEGLIIIKDVPFCKLKLNHAATDHVRVKSLTNTLIIPDIGLFDEIYDELVYKIPNVPDITCDNKLVPINVAIVPPTT